MKSFLVIFTPHNDSTIVCKLLNVPEPCKENAFNFVENYYHADWERDTCELQEIEETETLNWTPNPTDDSEED